MKEKRGIIKPLTAALRHKLNVSVAERPVVEETLRAADRVVEESDGVRIVDTVTVWR